MQPEQSGSPDADAGGSWPRKSIAEAHGEMTAPGAAFEFEEVDVRGTRLRSWKRGPATLREVLQKVAGYGDLPFIVYRDERVSFRDFSRGAVELAHRLRDAGVVKGDRVALAMSNRPEWPVVFMASVAIGAIIVPLNAWWTAEELDYGLENCGARIVFADAERARRMQASAEARGLRLIDVDQADADPLWIGPSAGWGKFDERPLPEVDVTPEDDATILYTSGTTGRSKGALGTHRNAAFAINAVGVSAERLRLRGGFVPTISGQRAQLVAGPLFHVSGCFVRFLPPLAAGTKMVLMPRWNAAEAARLIREENITSMGGVPTVVIQLLDHLEASGESIPTLRLISYGAAPSSPDLVARIRKVCPQALPAQAWAMTETTSIVTHTQGEEFDEYPAGCGPALPVWDLKVVGPDEVELPRGGVGELLVRGPGVVKGYWRNPEATAETFRDGWLRTGDLAKMDAEGNLYIVDRIKDVIFRGGENIYSSEVERVLESFPGVKEAALVPMPHPKLGEEPAAVLYADGNDVDIEALNRYAAERLAYFKVPVKYLVMKEPLPRNASGKIVKAGLKEMIRNGA